MIFSEYDIINVKKFDKLTYALKCSRNTTNMFDDIFQLNYLR